MLINDTINMDCLSEEVFFTVYGVHFGVDNNNDNNINKNVLWISDGLKIKGFFGLQQCFYIVWKIVVWFEELAEHFYLIFIKKN